jgi:hypothetical protein
MGQVLQGGAGQAPARQAAFGAGLPKEVPADTINKVCASSIRAVEIADLMVRSGDHSVVVAGGMESMSNAPYVLKKARFGYRLGDGTLIDLMTHDGLTSTFDQKHMVEQASFVSRELGISREDQDRWALRSHERAVHAIDNGLFEDELVSVNGVTVDESPRRDTSYEKLATLKPVFDPEGTTTAGNAPGVNDGAGALLVTSEEMGIEDVFEARTASGRSTSSARRKMSFFTSASSTTASTMRSAWARSPTGSTRLRTSSGSTSAPLATSRSRLFRIVSSPRSVAPGAASCRETRRPEDAITWAIPPPIWPAPTTRTCSNRTRGAYFAPRTSLRRSSLTFDAMKKAP